MRTLIVALAILLFTLPAFSQSMGRGGKHRGAEQKTAQPVTKASEKNYKSALDRNPAQKYDPWAPCAPGTPLISRQRALIEPTASRLSAA